MPFHSKPRLKVEILSESSVLSFKSSQSEIISYSADVGADGRKPVVKSAQRLGTGEALDARAWHFDVVTEDYAKAIPDLRLYRLIFEGREFTQRLNKRESVAALDLYRSVIAGDTVRLIVSVGAERLCPLDVQLSYELHEAEPKGDRAESC